MYIFVRDILFIHLLSVVVLITTIVQPLQLSPQLYSRVKNKVLCASAPAQIFGLNRAQRSCEESCVRHAACEKNLAAQFSPEARKIVGVFPPVGGKPWAAFRAFLHILT